MTMVTLGLSAGLVAVLLLLMRTLYWRVPAGFAYIRTGIGAERVLFGRGGFVIPGLHQVSAISLRSFSVGVSQVGEHSVLTCDPLRVDVTLGVLARIRPEQAAIVAARQTFGGDVDKIRPLLEERCKVVVQAVASKMPFDTLICNRLDFELEVQQCLNAEMHWAGLELILVSVSDLQQTSQLHYHRDERSIDGQALSLLAAKRLAETCQLHARMRDAELAIKRLDFDAALKTLEWDAQYALARLEHQRHQTEVEARVRQDIAEIEVSQALAEEMVRRDMALAQLQYQQEVEEASHQRALAA